MDGKFLKKHLKHSGLRTVSIQVSFCRLVSAPKIRELSGN